MTVIVFGSKRAPDISVPLESIGQKVLVLPCFGSLLERICGSVRFLKACLKNPSAPIITDTPHWVGLITFTVSSLLRRSYIVSLRGNIFRERPLAIFKMMNRSVIKRAAGVVFISRYLERAMAEELPNLESKSVIHAPHARMKESPGAYSRPFDQTILTVTKFQFKKKIEPLLSAFKAVDRVLEKYTSARWVICGGGPFLGLAKRARCECRNKERIIIKGHCEDIGSYYGRAQVFLYFTGLDAFPLVVNEAFLFGLPVVANKESAMPEMIAEGVDGILIDRYSNDWEKDLFDALSDLLDHPKKCALMGDQGKKKVLGICSQEKIGRSYLNFILKAGFCFK